MNLLRKFAPRLSTLVIAPALAIATGSLVTVCAFADPKPEGNAKFGPCPCENSDGGGSVEGSGPGQLLAHGVPLLYQDDALDTVPGADTLQSDSSLKKLTGRLVADGGMWLNSQPPFSGEYALRSVPIDAAWTLTFDEEFNGSSIDTGIWGTNWLGDPGTVTKPVNSKEIAAYDPVQVSVADGYLHLKAIDSPVTVNGTTYQYRSGLINTYDSFQQAFGYFEARIFLPGTGGKISNWPAFWMDGENWPEDGELDIVEGLYGTAAYHFHSPSGAPGWFAKGDYTGWHIFGALWEPGRVRFYNDSQLVGEITSGITDKPMYMILNFGIGSGMRSIVDVPSEMLVDWVHAYSISPNASAVTPQPGYEGP
jgi:hypothetical protein